MEIKLLGGKFGELCLVEKSCMESTEFQRTVLNFMVTWLVQKFETDFLNLKI